MARSRANAASPKPSLPSGLRRVSTRLARLAFVTYLSYAPTGEECATVLTAEKVRCSPSSPCSRATGRAVRGSGWLHSSHLLRCAPWLGALPGRGGKAGSPIEPESWICEVAARTDGTRLRIEGDDADRCPVAGRPTPALRVALACVLIDRRQIRACLANCVRDPRGDDRRRDRPLHFSTIWPPESRPRRHSALASTSRLRTK